MSVGDKGGVSCLSLGADGLVKIEPRALAKNLPLESLALCMSFLFSSSQVNSSFSDLPVHSRCKKRAYSRNY